MIDDPANDINTALGTGVGINVLWVYIPEDTLLARISLFDAQTDGTDDLDLYVWYADDGFVFAGGSGSGTSAEQVNLPNASKGWYYVVIHG